MKLLRRESEEYFAATEKESEPFKPTNQLSSMVSRISNGSAHNDKPFSSLPNGAQVESNGIIKAAAKPTASNNNGGGPGALVRERVKSFDGGNCAGISPILYQNGGGAAKQQNKVVPPAATVVPNNKPLTVEPKTTNQTVASTEDDEMESLSVSQRKAMFENRGGGPPKPPKSFKPSVVSKNTHHNYVPMATNENINVFRTSIPAKKGPLQNGTLITNGIQVPKSEPTNLKSPEPLVPKSVTPEPVVIPKVVTPEPPVVHKPVTPEPVFEKPVTPEPAFQKPKTPEPVFHKPVTPEPIIQTPVTLEPVIQKPVTPEPVIQKPVTPEPVIQKPITPEPVVIQPKKVQSVVPDVVPEPFVITNDPVAYQSEPKFVAPPPAPAQFADEWAQPKMIEEPVKQTKMAGKPKEIGHREQPHIVEEDEDEQTIVIELTQEMGLCARALYDYQAGKYSGGDSFLGGVYVPYAFVCIIHSNNYFCCSVRQ